MDSQDVAKALTITQIAQAIASLGIALRNAVESGNDSVTVEELAQSFRNKDEALTKLAEAITRAKAEGR